MSNLTLVAYKPNSDAYCRGCHMESFGSDFSLTIDSRDEIIAKWAYLLFENSRRARSEARYEITLLINGLDNGHDLFDDNLEHDLQASAQVVANGLIAAEADRKLRAELAQKAAAKRHEREEKLQQFIKLKAEFEPEGELP